MTVPAVHQSSSPDTWVETYGDYLYGFAFYRVQDDLVAQELVQDTLVAALEARKNFSGNASEKTWLTSILKHKIMDLFRKKYRDANLDGGTLDEREIHARFDHHGRWKTGPARWASDPERLVAQKDFIEILHQCLKEMPERAARALTLRELDGESTQTLCKVLNVTPTNCWVILHRARFQLRQCIEAKWLK